MNNSAKKNDAKRLRITEPKSDLGVTSYLGAQGERLATGYLAERGYEIIQRNAAFSCGEIDVIALDGDEVVFVEVKSRSGAAFGGAEAVSAAKFRRMRKAAAQWLRETGVRGYRSIRFDVIVVMFARGEVDSIEHYEGVDHGAC